MDDDAGYILERLSDPKVVTPPLPTPHTDLQAFIEGACDALRLRPSSEIKARLEDALQFANDLLAYLHMSATDVRAFRDRPELKRSYNELRAKVVKRLGRDPLFDGRPLL